MDTIAACAFGIDAGSFKDSKSDFVKNAQHLFRRKIIDCVYIFAYSVPGLRQIMQALKIGTLKPKETSFFAEAIAETLKHRQDKIR